MRGREEISENTGKIANANIPRIRDLNCSSNFNKLRARSPILAGDINRSYFKILCTTVTLMNQNNSRNERFDST